jgi:excisionase family DNA binding protein
MKVLAGQLSLLELERPVDQHAPASPIPARQARTRDDKPAEKLTRDDEHATAMAHARPTPTSGGGGLLTTSEAAVRLHVHPRTVQRLVERGRLSAVHLGSAVRFDPQDIELLIADVKDRRRRPQVDTFGTRRGATATFANRLRSQRNEHRAAQT